MGHKGEIMADQAHRGYTVATDADGYASVNPLYMKYTPDEEGYFAGQQGYGYKSLDLFTEAASKLRLDSNIKTSDFDSSLATLRSCSLVTAILEAGRRSLDVKGEAIYIHANGQNPTSLALTPQTV